MSFYQLDGKNRDVDCSVPVPDVGADLKAALPQAPVMSCFEVKSKRLSYMDAYDKDALFDNLKMDSFPRARTDFCTIKECNTANCDEFVDLFECY